MKKYFNYHAKINKLIKEKQLIDYKFFPTYHHISPALVLYFKDYPPMPIRQHQFVRYQIILQNYFENVKIKQEVKEMLKFSEYKYEELNIDQIKKDLNKLIEELEKAKSAKKQYELILKINEYRKKVETNMSIASVRFTINTADPYYIKQNELIDNISPIYSALITKYYKTLVNSNFRNSLEKKLGKSLFQMAETAIKSFDDKIVEEAVEENKLVSEYTKLMASAKIKFEGKIYNLSQMGKFSVDKDRKIRAAASRATSNWMLKHRDEIDDIFDKLVHVRDKMAKKLGFNSFTELAYYRLNRTDYNADDVKFYRDQVYKYLLPVSKKLFKRQAKRLQIKNIKYYDYNLEFLSGNATPVGDKNYLLEQAKNMYDDMSKETSEFFNFMINSELLDLEAKPNKAGGGYCTSFPEYKAPFIFANFNGTSGDVDVLTHEVGHAFMCYCCKDVELLEYVWATYEACEIHSMSMEFFAYPYMDKFFKEAKDKYIFSHLSNAITFIPYGCAIDEFQHYVYANVDDTPAMRREKWREIEKKYLPHLKYKGNKFLEEGGKWLRQSHVFQNPFYYIDYTLAQMCAFQFFNAMNENRQDAWNRYVNLCKLGGSKTFLNLLKDKNVHLDNPFKKGVIRKTIKPLSEFLDKFDDSKM